MKRTLLPFATALIALSPLAFAQGLPPAEGKACELTTPEEIQAIVGAKPTLKGSTLPNGVEVCTGKAGTSTVTIRLYPKKDDEERDKEEARLDGLKKQGATIETRKVAGANCMELRPGGKAARQPYTTSCTTIPTSRAPKFVVVEVSNPSTSIEMRKLGPLVESIKGRIF